MGNSAEVGSTSCDYLPSSLLGTWLGRALVGGEEIGALQGQELLGVYCKMLSDILFMQKRYGRGSNNVQESRNATEVMPKVIE